MLGDVLYRDATGESELSQEQLMQALSMFTAADQLAGVTGEAMTAAP